MSKGNVLAMKLGHLSVILYTICCSMFSMAGNIYTALDTAEGCWTAGESKSISIKRERRRTGSVYLITSVLCIYVA